MIEVVIRKYLKSKMNVPVGLEHPSDSFDRFIVFEKTGSTLENHLKTSTFAFQSYAESMFEAAKLNEELKEHLLKMNVNEVAGVYINSDYNFTDTETTRYRYQAVVEIRHY